jgi:hypothetical protein
MAEPTCALIAVHLAKICLQSICVVRHRSNHCDEAIKRESLNERGPPNSQIVFNPSKPDAETVLLPDVLKTCQNRLPLQTCKTGFDPDPRTTIGPLMVG